MKSLIMLLLAACSAVLFFSCQQTTYGTATVVEVRHTPETGREKALRFMGIDDYYYTVEDDQSGEMLMAIYKGNEPLKIGQQAKIVQFHGNDHVTLN